MLKTSSSPDAARRPGLWERIKGSRKAAVGSSGNQASGYSGPCPVEPRLAGRRGEVVKPSARAKPTRSQEDITRTLRRTRLPTCRFSSTAPEPEISLSVIPNA
ncbi:hypothetical protein DPEC_G00297410 [Dallia pectoralis]|uniref:Uncharacterized protein n=1 Tax=Dallia pectoralis TaxID=75939 RepID=A0ACC2FFP8_DALPE|nr:hypothetical protein DPEC_G00297410 [Dallia pectoralis]